MVHLVGIGEFTVGRLPGCRCPFTESTLTALDLRIKMNAAAPKTHHEIHSSPVTASNSRRHARKHIPRVRPNSPASVDPGFVEIGLVQLSQSVKTTNVTHTDTQTD